MEQERCRFDGPTRIGKSLDLRGDFYSAAFLNWFKIEYITGKPKPNPLEKTQANPKRNPDPSSKATGLPQTPEADGPPEEAGQPEASQAI